MLRRLLLSLLLFGVTIGTTADGSRVETLLNNFDAAVKDGSTAKAAQLANEFLGEMHSLNLLEQPVTFSQAASLDTLCQQVWYWSGEYLYNRQDYHRAALYASKALPLTKGTEQESDCLNLLAITYVRLSDYETAASFAKQCYAIDEKAGDPDIISSTLNTLTAIYLSAGQPKEAEQYILKGIEMAEKANNPSRMAILQATASEVYHALGENAVALKYIERAYELDKQQGNEERMVVRLAQKAAVLIGLCEYADAVQILRTVIPSLRKSGNRHSMAIACNDMGKALFLQGNEQEANVYYREAAEVFSQMGDIYNEIHARKGLYECLWKSDPTEAKRQIDRFNELKDSIYSNTSADRLARYNAEFGNDWLKLENHEQRKAKLWAIVSALIALLLAVGIWFFMWRRHRMQQRINKQLTENIKELRERYDALSEHYDNAIAAAGKDNSEELIETDREFLEKTINTIHELMLNGQIDANHVAEHMGMSLFQFRQRLSNLTDETPQSFINIMRMRRAKHLLDRHPEMNVSEVGMLCAYNDTPNFTRAFKRTFGLTPTQYLEKARAEK